MLARFTQQHALPFLAMRSAACFTTTTSLRGLEEIIPKLPAEGDPPVAAAGRSSRDRMVTAGRGSVVVVFIAGGSDRDPCFPS